MNVILDYAFCTPEACCTQMQQDQRQMNQEDVREFIEVKAQQMNDEPLMPILTPRAAKERQMPPANQLIQLDEVEIQSGLKYTGQWLGEHFHGCGSLVRPDGSRYEGMFIQGRAHGMGKFFCRSGNSYDGMWLQDQAHGRGFYRFRDGSTYEGEWVCDEKCGEGVDRWPDGSVYVGQYRKNKKTR